MAIGFDKGSDHNTVFIHLHQKNTVFIHSMANGNRRHNFTPRPGSEYDGVWVREKKDRAPALTEEEE